MIYEVIFKVKAPIIATSDIHFDSILYAVSPARHNKDNIITRLTSQDQINDLPIPVDCIKIGDRYIYCCSVARYTNAYQITETSTKRKDGLDYMFYHTAQSPKSGIDKDSMIKLYGVSCEEVHFILSSSNLKELERYCKRIKSIGSMRKQGYGQVSDCVIVTRSDLDWHDCVINNGQAARNIPKCFLENECKSFDRCKPPYFLLDGKEAAAKVGDKAILKTDVYLSKFRRTTHEI